MRGRSPFIRPPRGRRGARGVDVAGGFCVCAGANEEARASFRRPGFRKTAATYSPNWWVSTIGDGELNFSVRNGKRWILTAITTAVYYLREKTQFGEPSGPLESQSDLRYFLAYLSLRKVFRAISTGQLRTSPPLHFLPINVVVSHDPQGKIHLEDGFALRCFQRLS